MTKGGARLCAPFRIPTLGTTNRAVVRYLEGAMQTLPYIAPRRAVCSLALLMLVASCGDGALAPDGVARLVLAAGPRSLYVGDTARLTAIPVDLGGRPMAGRAVRFTSSAPHIAAVDATTGLITAHAPGVALITATCAGAAASMEVRVAMAPVATISVTPDAHTLHPQWTLTLGVALADAAGRPLTGRQVDFTSSDPNVAAVGSTGLVTAGTVGTATITAVSEGRADAAVITVTPAEIFAISISPDVRAVSDGTLRQYHAVVSDVRGYTLTDRPITWASSDTNIAVVASNGMVSARLPGGVVITARSGSVTGSLPLTVRPHIETIAMALDKDTLRVNEFGAAAIYISDAEGNRLVDREVTLSSSNPAVLAVLSDGRLRAMQTGTAVVTAKAEGRTATATVTVIENVVFVRLEPSFVTVPKGSAFQLTTSVLDGMGRVLTGRMVAYASSNPLVATVSADGIITGLAKGEAIITASCEGRSGMAKVTVP